jgi:DNA-directed RNA polymerase subunit K/omega
MVSRPAGANAFEFVIVASLRAKQLMNGCVPRSAGHHKLTTMAQMEVAGGFVAKSPAIPSSSTT